MKTALILFDSSLLSLIVQKMVTDMDMKAITVKNEKEFSTALTDQKIDVVLTDTLYRKKENPFLSVLKRQKIPFLVISDKDDPDDIKSALKKGAGEYIIKPFDHDILQSKLSIMGLGE